MKKLIRKVKQFFGLLPQVQYVIEYTNPLSATQFTEIMSHMITKFPPNCRPHSIQGVPGTNSVRLMFDDTCMSVDELTRIGNVTIERIPPNNPVKSVTINGITNGKKN